MAVARVKVRDHERFARARALGQERAQDASAVVEARYELTQDAFELRFRGGGTMRIPRPMIPGLDGVPTVALKSISISPAGDALSWLSLDIDIYVPGLVEQAFGTGLFARATGQRGGRRRSKAKAAASKVNGAKGGRPRKRLST